MASVTPLPADNTEIVAGGTAVQVFPANPAGGFLQNPWDAADQDVSPAEPIYVDPINVPGSTPGSGNGTTFVIYPGQNWDVIPGQTTPTRFNAATTGHKISAIYWR